MDFAQYAAWEISLEHLRQKRCKRLRIKGSTTYSGQARIFSIFDRGTKKHPGDVALWMSYLECARTAKATKKWKATITSALRLHPLKSELWLYAARWTLQQEADMETARDYMRRGTRFCTRSPDLWIEYAKMEMIFRAKVAMRRKILGLDVDRTIEAAIEDDEDMAEDPGFTTSQDMIAIPNYKTHALQPSMIEGVQVDSEATIDPLTTPLLNEKIPRAIFDVARKQPFFCASTAENFFDMFASFTQVRCMPSILQHVLGSMTVAYPTDPCTLNCYIRQPLIGLNPTSADFPMALGSSLDRLKEALGGTEDRETLAKKTRTWIESILELQDLDPGIETVLRHTLRKLA